jgi:hypothetical protein
MSKYYPDFPNPVLINVLIQVQAVGNPVLPVYVD